MARTKKVNPVVEVESKGYPEVGHFTDKKDLQKFYKALPTETLEDWCAVEGLEYKACPDSEAIHRMRVAMAILGLHFPKTPAKPKSKAKYTQTLEELVQMCLDGDVAVEPTEDTRIMRMRCIMNLRANGIIE